MAPNITQILTLALLAVCATAADVGYGQPPPPPYGVPGPVNDPSNGGSGFFPPGFPFNNLPPLPVPGVLPSPPPAYASVPLSQLTTSKAGGVFTSPLPSGPGGPIDPNCPKTVVSYSVVTHISTTVISYTNTLTSLQTLTNSICAPIIPTLPPPVFTSETAGGVFTTPNNPGGSLATHVTLTTLATSKVTLPTIPGGPNPTLPTGPVVTLPTVPGGPGGPGATSKSFSFIPPPPIQTYPPPGPPVYPPTVYPPPNYGSGGNGGYGEDN